VLPKPVDVFDRDAEWADLVEFTASGLPGLRIAVVYGRRRHGKSYLLRRLAGAMGGLYHLATEQTEVVSLRRFAQSVTGWLGLPGGGLAFDSWEAALTSATGLMAGRAGTAGTAPLLVLDEFPYLTQESPAYRRFRHGPGFVQRKRFHRRSPGAVRAAEQPGAARRARPAVCEVIRWADGSGSGVGDLGVAGACGQ